MYKLFLSSVAAFVVQVRAKSEATIKMVAAATTCCWHRCCGCIERNAWADSTRTHAHTLRIRCGAVHGLKDSGFVENVRIKGKGRCHVIEAVRVAGNEIGITGIILDLAALAATRL